MWRKWIPHTLPLGRENNTTSLENSFAVSEMIKLYDPAIYLRKMKIYVHKTLAHECLQ